MPGARHAQVGVQDAAVAERQQQVLAARLDRFEHVAVDRVRQAVGRLVARPARDHRVARERRDAPRRDLERVALGQGATAARAGTGAAGRRRSRRR